MSFSNYNTEDFRMAEGMRLNGDRDSEIRSFEDHDGYITFTFGYSPEGYALEEVKINNIHVSKAELHRRAYGAWVDAYNKIKEDLSEEQKYAAEMQQMKIELEIEYKKSMQKAADTDRKARQLARDMINESFKYFRSGELHNAYEKVWHATHYSADFMRECLNERSFGRFNQECDRIYQHWIASQKLPGLYDAALPTWTENQKARALSMCLYEGVSVEVALKHMSKSDYISFCTELLNEVKLPGEKLLQLSGDIVSVGNTWAQTEEMLRAIVGIHLVEKIETFIQRLISNTKCS